MPYLYLALSVIFCSATNVFTALFNRKKSGISGALPFYDLVRISSCFASWLVIYAINPSFDIAVLPYALGFGLLFVLASVFYTLAVKTGPFAITALLTQTSLMLATVWGIFFWEADFSFLTAIGLICVMASIYLLIFGDKKEERDDKKVNVKWLVYVLVATFGNAFLTIIQREQQNVFHGEHGSMLMTFGLGVASVLSLIRFFKSDRSNASTLARSSLPFPVASGVTGALLNLFVILLASTALSPAVIYPVLAVGALMLNVTFSIVTLREKMSAKQWIGFALGVLAITLLNL